jgi:hypothetical protein
MGRKKWAELFFIDNKDCVSAILFHGYSVDNLLRLIEPLFYEDLTLADVVLTVTAERKENVRVTPKSTYYIASFSYTAAQAAKVQELAQFTADHRIYRGETLTETAQYQAVHGCYLGHQDGLLTEAA